MKQIDILFSANTLNELKNVIGQRVICVTHPPFDEQDKPSVYGKICLFCDDGCYKITNFIEPYIVDGNNERVAVLRFEKANATCDTPPSQGKTPIKIDVDSDICEITVVNEEQRLFQGGKQTYSAKIVRALIFKLANGKEVSVEKPLWFSDELYFNVGTRLINSLSPVDEFGEQFEDYCRGSCSREFISLT